MPDDFLRALALVMVMEGLMPFLSPARLRLSLLRIASLEDKTLRHLGLAALIGGVLLLKYSGA